jgi:zinc protease
MYMSLSHYLFRLTLVLVASATLVLPAWSTPALTEPLPINPRIRLGKLPNGLTYYIQKNGKPAHRVEMRLLVKAGSVLEDDDQRGLAHFVEHMAFNGSGHFKKHELVSWFQSIGVRFGADLNAFTGFDTTHYVLSVPTDKPEHVQTAFKVMEDWAHSVALDSQAIDEERPIILQEMRQRRTFGRRLSEAVRAKLANGSRYGAWPSIGTADSVSNSKPEALRRFYTDWYRPDLMAVVVVGDIEPDAVEHQVRLHFSHLKMPAQPRMRPAAVVEPLRESQALIHVDKEAPGNHIELRYPVVQSKGPATWADYRQSLVRSLFNLMMTDRVSQIPVVGMVPYLGGSGAVQGLGFASRHEGFTLIAKVGTNGYGPAVDALVKHSERVRQFGFNPSELELAKRKLMATVERVHQARASTDSTAYATDIQRHFFDDEAIPGVEDALAWTKAHLPGIQLHELHRFAQSVIVKDAPKLAIYVANGSDGKPMPTQEELLERVAQAHKLEVAQLPDRGLPLPLLASRPEPGSIEAESTDAQLGITRLTLSNGVKVVLKPTRFNEGSVQMLAVRPGGHMLFDDEDKDAALYATQAQAVMGFGRFPPVEMQRVLAGQRVTLMPAMTRYHDMFNGSSASGEVETLLQLLYVYMTAPRSDKNMFNSYVMRNVEQSRNLMANPDARFKDARLRALYGGHPRVDLAPRPETFQKLDMDRTLAVYRSRLTSAKGMTFVFVGDFEVEAIKPLLTGYLAALPATDLPLVFRDPGIRQVPGVVRQEVRAGQEKKGLVSFDFSGDTTWSSQDELVFQFLKDVLHLRLLDTLRERDQLIYSAGVGGDYASVPRGSYRISIDLPTAPEHAGKVEKAVLAEIARLQSMGPGADDLNKVRQAALMSFRRRVNEDGYWVQVLRAIAVDGRDPADVLNMEQRILAVTEAQVQAAAQRFLNREHYLQMVLKPEN